MKQFWSDSELNDYWILSAKELKLLKGKTGLGRIYFCILLKNYQLTSNFSKDISLISNVVSNFIAGQLGIAFEGFDDVKLYERSFRYYCKEIRYFLGINQFNNIGKSNFKKWAINNIFPNALDIQRIDVEIKSWFIEYKFVMPSKQVLKRLINSAEQTYEKNLFNHINNKLSLPNQAKLNNLLDTTKDISDFSKLRADTGNVSLVNVISTISRLKLLREIELPNNLISDLSLELIERYRLRAGAEDVWELRRHSKITRLALLSFYCVPREAEIIDGLVELLINITYKISARAERKVVNELVKELTKVNGKTNLLFRIAEAANNNPDDTVRDVIFPVVGKETITNLVKEYHYDGPAYVQRIYRKMRASYANHYRRMLPQILSVLEFRSNNISWKPLLDAIDTLKNNASSNIRYFSIDDVPIKGIVPSKWLSSIIEEDLDGKQRINCINYEICVLHSLREKLRSKEIWVVGAKSFCNPENDLPQDFDDNRNKYYASLNQPLSASVFINDLKYKIRTSLSNLNSSLPNNSYVVIKPKNGKHQISITPLDPLEDPPNLNSLKLELNKRWPGTSLLDVFKETDLRVSFTKAFTSTASRTTFEQSEISRKLLLTLYGIGSNAGLKALAAGPNNVSYKELLYIKRRYIHRDSLREATRIVTNATFEARATDIWGTGTTSCASDSTKFAAWDQNLITEWHHRYGGRGIMIYWHVDTNSTCIHSQLKRCSSSEVASMIEGILHHGTEMKIDNQYVDTHGQSIIAFAFCYLLGFNLMPRFKGINKQKLVRPDKKLAGDYPNIDNIFTKSSINWEIITQQYDEMIKFATALIEKTADTEAILRRFIRGQAKHPVYFALIELGKAAKTIFLCKYLSSKSLRREIHTGLNVVERWNGVNNFIYFGKNGEFTTNKLEDQEISALSLHLLQSSMVFINTLMIQEILSDPSWKMRMTERDMAALSPLPHNHLNPYGNFDLDMNDRLQLKMTGITA